MNKPLMPPDYYEGIIRRLEAERDSLKAQVEWEVVPDGRYTREMGNIIGPIAIGIDSKSRIIACQYEWSPRDIDQIQLPEGWVICRRKGSEGEVANGE